MGRRRGSVAGVVGAVLAFGLAAAQPILGQPAHPPARPPGTAAGGLHVIPFPGTPDAAPTTQIIFSSLPRIALASVTVRGSDSGTHSGRLTVLPERAGTAFMPDRPFTPGERVSVAARLSGPAAWGHRSGGLHFSFTVEAPVHRSARVSRAGGSAGISSSSPSFPTQHLRSRDNLHPPVVRAGSDPDTTSGDIFLTPKNGPQSGPMILDGQGRLVWFISVSPASAFNLEVETYEGRRVLTWWQGDVVDGHGSRGQDVIMDSSYRTVAVLHAGNGYSSDLHEFQLAPSGSALIDAYVPVRANLSSVGGPRHGTVLDCVIQKLDVATGRVLWEWHALGHVPLSASSRHLTGSGPYDYFHLNSIQQLPGGNLLISARNTSAVYKIGMGNGKVRWTLGGKRSSFRMSPGAKFEYQHDARLHGNVLSLFDDASDGPTQAEWQSSAKELRINRRRRKVSLLRRVRHSPPVIASSEGNAQILPNHDLFVGWGSQPYFSEYSPTGKQILNASLGLGINTYRAYRFPWTAQPLTAPSLGISPASNGRITVYASWNGATTVASWRVLGGTLPSALTVKGQRLKTGFETPITVNSGPAYFAVQALDASGNVLASSSAHAVPTG